jgi:hypothetical protein
MSDGNYIGVHIERKQIPYIIRELQAWAASSPEADHAILSLPTEEGQVVLVSSCYCNKAAPKEDRRTCANNCSVGDCWHWVQCGDNACMECTIT